MAASTPLHVPLTNVVGLVAYDQFADAVPDTLQDACHSAAVQRRIGCPAEFFTAAHAAAACAWLMLVQGSTCETLHARLVSEPTAPAVAPGWEASYW